MKKYETPFAEVTKFDVAEEIMISVLDGEESDGGWGELEDGNW